MIVQRHTVCGETRSKTIFVLDINLGAVFSNNISKRAEFHLPSLPYVLRLTLRTHLSTYPISLGTYGHSWDLDLVSLCMDDVSKLQGAKT